jgi:hypothetical protein
LRVNWEELLAGHERIEIQIGRIRERDFQSLLVGSGKATIKMGRPAILCHLGQGLALRC